jgi:hypothetical protein
MAFPNRTLSIRSQFVVSFKLTVLNDYFSF